MALFAACASCDALLPVGADEQGSSASSFAPPSAPSSGSGPFMPPPDLGPPPDDFCRRGLPWWVFLILGAGIGIAVND